MTGIADPQGNAVSVETFQPVHDILSQATGTAERLFEGYVLTICENGLDRIPGFLCPHPS